MVSLPILAKKLAAENPDLKIVVDKFSSGPPVDSAVELSIDGPDLSVLKALGRKLELIIREAPDVYLTVSELSQSSQNLEFKFDESSLRLILFQVNFLLMN